MTMVAFENVTLRYGERVILENFSLQVKKGERLVIFGPSGSGKTTILRMVAGFVAPERGTVSIADRPVSADGRILVPPEKRGVGMVFQDLALWPHMSVEENVGFGLMVRKVPKMERKRRVEEILELVGLKGFGSQNPSDLSGGEQQRVALARALILEPDVLLMDEPLSSLDRPLAEHLAHEIVRLQKRVGFTLLYVTHLEEEAAIIGTRRLTIRKHTSSSQTSRPEIF